MNILKLRNPKKGAVLHTKNQKNCFLPSFEMLFAYSVFMLPTQEICLHHFGHAFVLGQDHEKVDSSQARRRHRAESSTAKYPSLSLSLPSSAKPPTNSTFPPLASLGFSPPRHLEDEERCSSRLSKSPWGWRLRSQPLPGRIPRLLWRSRRLRSPRHHPRRPRGRPRPLALRDVFFRAPSAVDHGASRFATSPPCAAFLLVVSAWRAGAAKPPQRPYGKERRRRG